MVLPSSCKNSGTILVKEYFVSISAFLGAANHAFTVRAQFATTKVHFLFD